MDDFVRQSIVENSAPWRPPYPWGNLPPRDDVRTLARDWTSDRIAAIEANCGVVLRAAGILRKTPAGTWQFTTGLTPGLSYRTSRERCRSPSSRAWGCWATSTRRSP